VSGTAYNNGSARTVVISTAGTDTQPGGIFLINIPNIATPGSNSTVFRPTGPAPQGTMLLPSATVSDLASIPAAAAPDVAVGGNPILFAALTPGSVSNGVQPGIYQSTDGGTSWLLITASENALLATASRIRFGVYSNTATHQFALYAGVIKPTADGQGLDSILSYDHLVGGFPTLITVAASPVNLSVDNGKNNGLNPSDQGDLHVSIAVDPNNPYAVFVGGDVQDIIDSQAGNSQFDARIFGFDFCKNPATFTQVTSAFAPGAGPGPGATATAGTKKNTGIFPAGATYKYAISYIDSAGEESALSSTFSVVIPGTTVPAVSVSLANLAAGAPAGGRIRHPLFEIEMRPALAPRCSFVDTIFG
jgi:hypothetical protein